MKVCHRAKFKSSGHVPWRARTHGASARRGSELLYLEARGFGLDRFAEAAAHRNGFAMAPGRLVMGSNLT